MAGRNFRKISLAKRALSDSFPTRFSCKRRAKRKKKKKEREKKKKKEKETESFN